MKENSRGIISISEMDFLIDRLGLERLLLFIEQKGYDEILGNREKSYISSLFEGIFL